MAQPERRRLSLTDLIKVFFTAKVRDEIEESSPSSRNPGQVFLTSFLEPTELQSEQTSRESGLLRYVQEEKK